MQAISIIIVTYNNGKEIKSCLDSIFKKSPNIEIIIVDNNSKDNTSKTIKSFGNKIKFIESEINLGFGKANNLGVREATGEYLVFLNPDTIILEENFFVKLAISLEENPQYGLIGPQIINSDKTIQKSVRKLPTVWGAFKEYIFNQKGAYDFYEPKCHNLCEVESVVGACIVIKKDLFNKLGGFNEKYFMYFEDLELCKQIRKDGFKVGFLPSLKIEHRVGASGFGKPTPTFARISAQKYNGLFKYYLIEFILTPKRLMNKIKRSL